MEIDIITSALISFSNYSHCFYLFRLCIELYTNNMYLQRCKMKDHDFDGVHSVDSN